MRWRLRLPGARTGRVLWWGLLASGMAQAREHDFNIPAENAALSIPELARQAGVQIVAPGGLAQTRTSGVQGHLDTREALRRLLGGTNLYVAADDGNVIALRRTEPAERAPAPVEHAPVCTVCEPPVPQATDMLEQVVVTADKRNEDLSRVPATINVFSGEKLLSEGVVRIDGLQNLAPSMGVSRSPDGGVALTLRGVTSTDFTPKGQPGVGFTIDGIAIERPLETGTAFFDVDRVEVVSGPQGTLYGNSTTGGTVNLITNKPKPDFEAGGSLEFGNYDAWRGTAYVNIPFNETFALRAAGNFNKVDGWLAPAGGGEALNTEDNSSGRLTGLLHLGGNATLTLTGTAGTQGGAGGGQDPYGNFVAYSGAAQRAIYSDPIQQFIDDRFGNLNGEFNGDFGPIHVAYDGAHLYYWAHDLTSSDANAALIGGWNWLDERHTFTTSSHEIRVSNADAGNWDWLLGANLLREDIHEMFHLWTAPLADPTVSASVNALNPINVTTHQSAGVFGQTSYRLGDRLRLTVGVRDSSDSTDRVGTFAQGPGWPNAQGDSCIAPENCIGDANNGHQSEAKWTYRGAVDYELLPNQLLYASIATGYKAGGFNDFDPKTGHTAPYAPEEMTAYEVGYKGQPLSTLQFDSAAYYYDYAREQITSLVMFYDAPASSPVAAVVYTQSVPTTIYGWENALHWKPAHADLLDASVVLMKSRFDRYLAGDTAFISAGGAATIGSVHWDGLSLDNTPAFVATLGLTHTFLLPKGASLSAHLESRFSSSYVESDPAAASTLDPGNHDSRFTQPAFTRSDATLTYASADGRFSLQAFVSNIENKVQMTGPPGALPTNTGLPPAGASYGSTLSTAQLNTVGVNVTPPRLFGVRMNIKY